MHPPPTPPTQTSPRKPHHKTHMNTIITLLKTHVSSHPRLWLFITFLCFQVLFISIARRPSPCTTLPRRPTPTSTPNHSISLNVSTTQFPTPNKPKPKNAHDLPIYTEKCPYGKFYVYDLPSTFNKDLLLPNCTDLDPWNWQCGIATNHGYGRAATELLDMLPGNLAASWYRTNQFTLELIFHHRVSNHRCRTLEPESAAAFYIPFYAGLAVGKFLWTNDTAMRDSQCETMLRWVKEQHEYQYWQRSNGSDHFTTIGRITWDFRRLTDPGRVWGSSFLNMPDMQKVTRFIIEKAPGDDRDVGVPYPTGFHPKTRDSLVEWQNYVRSYNRSSLFTFIGATRGWVSNDFRGLLLSYCYNESGSCRVVDCAVSPCSTDTSVILKALLGSEFCLQPRGDSFTRRSVFDCMVAGSVPVFFWKRTAYDQYQWFLPGEPESYSVFIDHEEVRNGSAASIKQVLKRYSKEEIRRKREKVIETIPSIIYALPNRGLGSFRDAFDIAVDGVLERIKEDREWDGFL